MKLSFLIVLIIFISSIKAKTCPCKKPIANVATFNVFGADTSDAFLPRQYTLGNGLLLNYFEDNKLDAFCLQETWLPELRSLLFNKFTEYTVYQPPRTNQPNCANSCSDSILLNGTIGGISLTKTAQEWMNLCSFTPIPNTNVTCSDQIGDLEYIGCISQMCPSLINSLYYPNFDCLVCLSNPLQTNDTKKNRLSRCAQNYSKEDASNCKSIYGGHSSITLITKNPPLETDYHPFPEQYNLLDNRGVAYAKIKTDFGAVNVFCHHTISGTQQTDENDPFYPIHRGQMETLINYANTKIKNNEPAIIIGDFNAGFANPSKNVQSFWPGNLQLMYDAGYKNAIGTPECTYGCSSLAKLFYGEDYQRQSIDHIFYKGKPKHQKCMGGSFFEFENEICSVNQTIFFTEDIIPYGGSLVSLSDHFGVSASICNDWGHLSERNAIQYESD